MSAQQKPSPEEVRRLLTNEALTRIRLGVARAREYNRLMDEIPQITFHQCRNQVMQLTEKEFRAYEKARVALITAAYIINGRLAVTSADFITQTLPG